MRTSGGVDAASRPAQGSVVRLTMIGSDQIVSAPLARETAAQVVRWRGTFIVQIAEGIPPHLYRQVAQHTIDRHQTQCIASHCVKARDWLAIDATTEEAATVA